MIRPAGLSRFFGIESALIAGRGPGLGAVQEFIAGAGEGRVRVFYDEGGFSIHGVLRIEAAGPGG